MLNILMMEQKSRIHREKISIKVHICTRVVLENRVVTGKSNKRNELVFSRIKDRLSMHIIAKYDTFMPLSNENIASCVILGFTVRRTSPSSSTSYEIFSP